MRARKKKSRTTVKVMFAVSMHNLLDLKKEKENGNEMVRGNGKNVVVSCECLKIERAPH